MSTPCSSTIFNFSNLFPLFFLLFWVTSFRCTQPVSVPPDPYGEFACEALTHDLTNLEDVVHQKNLSIFHIFGVLNSKFNEDFGEEKLTNMFVRRLWWTTSFYTDALSFFSTKNYV